jgi:hypothetical protein
MYNYRISGLSITSEMELRGAMGMPPDGETPDARVRFAAVPHELAGASASGPTWDLKDESFLLRVPRLARFLIQGGHSISVELEESATSQDASVFVLGTSLGILLHQRGALVLHGAAVARNGCAIAICGHSGAGKSTLAAALCGQGCEFVTDDICVIGLNSNRLPIVLPDGRQLKLWRQSIENLDLNARQGEAVRDTFEKYFIAPETVAAEPPRLSAIYVLRETRPPLESGIEVLGLPDAMRMLEYAAYRPGLRRRLGSKAQMLMQAAAMFGHAKAFRLTRPLEFEKMSAIVDELLTHWKGLGP